MSGQDVAIRTIGTLPERMEYARALADSGLLPAQYRGQPANLLWAIEYGQSIGISPMAAITGVHVIEGKPSASSQLIGGLVRRAGHTLRVRGNDTEATAQIIRRDDPDFTYDTRWTISRAAQAGLTGKSSWKKYPAAMLKARAITEAARDACPEALSGLLYTPEELGAVVDEDGQIVADAVPPPAPPGPAEPVRDWRAEALAVTDADQARELWRQASLAGALDDPLRELLTAAVEELGADRSTGEIVAEAEVVEASEGDSTEWPDVASPGGEAA